jgi:SHS2 domain-containing protein
VNHTVAKPAQGYSFLEHTTDAFIEAWGLTIEEAFGQAGRALFDTMLHVEKVDPIVQDTVEANGHDEKELLYNWLEELLLKFEINSMTYSAFKVNHIVQKVTGATLHAKIKGEPYNRQKHGSKTEVKGITYHLMDIIKSPTETRVRFLLDL